MQFSKQHKLLVLFLSDENPLWRELGHARLSKSALRKKLASGRSGESAKLPGTTRPPPSASTLYAWEQGKPFFPDTVNAFFANISADIEAQCEDDPGKRDKLLAVINKYKAACQNERVEVYTAARILGMDLETTQKVIDDMYYRRFPLLRSGYYDKAAADNHFKSYGGVFHLWVERDHSWLQCALRVRYIYIYEPKEGRTLRCKLNCPLIDLGQQEHLAMQKKPGASHPYFEYDGFLSVKPPDLFWTFESRAQHKDGLDPWPDFFYLIARASLLDRRLVLVGTYLTTGQDQSRSIVTGRAVMERVAIDGYAALKRTMRDIKVLEGAAREAPERLWHRLRALTPGIIMPGNLNDAMS